MGDSHSNGPRVAWIAPVRYKPWHSPEDKIWCTIRPRSQNRDRRCKPRSDAGRVPPPAGVRRHLSTHPRIALNLKARAGGIPLFCSNLCLMFCRDGSISPFSNVSRMQAYAFCRSSRHPTREHPHCGRSRIIEEREKAYSCQSGRPEEDSSDPAPGPSQAMEHLKWGGAPGLVSRPVDCCHRIRRIVILFVLSRYLP